jgi:hypothetical protein
VGDHLISFSRYRGLVSTRVAGPDAPRVEVTLPLRGLPVGLFLSEGVATVLVVDPVRHEQTSRVVLVDVRDPARPSTLGEQRFAGTLSAARQVGGALHVLTREIVDCINCVQLPDTDFTWFEFDRSRSLELPAPRVTRVQGAASFDEDVLIVLSAGAYMAGTPAELRLARLSDPEPALSAPMVLNGAGGVSVSGDRLRVHSGAEIETYALDTGTPVLLGRGALPQAEGGSLGGLLIEGDRAVSMLPPSGRLVVLDLSDPNAPRITAELTLDISESQVTLAGDRVLAAGGSTLAADAPGDADVIARGPQALVLVDIADPARPRILDRATLGGFDSVHTGPAKITSAPSKRSGRCSLRMAGATLNRSMPATTLVPCSSSAPPIRPSPSKCRAMSPTGATGRARGCTPTRSSATTSSTSPGRLLLDTDARNVAHLAVSNGSVYYATDSRRVAVSNDTPYYTTASGEVANGPAAPLAPRELTIERVVLRDGRFERLPSFDVVSAFDGVPMAWEHFAASGERVLWGSEGWLYVVDFSGSEPRVERHDLGLRGCTALDLRGNTAYCAQGTAGYREITLGTP